MIGWWLLFTLVVIIIGLVKEQRAGLANFFGWSSSTPNWAVVYALLVVLWVLVIEVKLGIL